MIRVPFVAVLTALAVRSAWGADFRPTRYDDPAPGSCFPEDCSLREAVLAANAAAGEDRVLLSAGVYTLTIVGDDDAGFLGDLDVTDAIEIIGPGATMTAISAPGLDDPVVSVWGTSSHLRGLAVRDADIHGVVLAGGAHEIEECHIVGNGSSSTHHGVTVAGGATLTASGSTFAGNAGAGVHGNNVAGSIVLTNVTAAQNGNRGFATSGDGGICLHCTLVDNDGGPMAAFNSASVTVASSILSGTCAVVGTLVSAGGNVESPGDTCGLALASDQVNVSAGALRLGSFGANGGPTPTRALLAGSFALGAAPTCSTTDQRGAPRPTGSCDSGAFELGPPDPPTPLFADGFDQGSAAAWSAVGP